MSKNLLILFPGVRYSTDCPLLYYTRVAYDYAGYEIIAINDYGIAQSDDLGSYADKAVKSLVKRLAETQFDKYEHIVFAEKSIGTLIGLMLSDALGLPDVYHIMYTPLEAVFNYINPERRIVGMAAGTTDKHIEIKGALGKGGYTKMIAGYYNTKSDRDKDASGYTLTILGDALQNKEIYAGYSTHGKTLNNTLELKGGDFSGSRLFGGNNGSSNRLTVHTDNTYKTNRAKSIENFDTLEFHPTAAGSYAMLSLSDGLSYNRTINIVTKDLRPEEGFIDLLDSDATLDLTGCSLQIDGQSAATREMDSNPRQVEGAIVVSKYGYKGDKGFIENGQVLVYGSGDFMTTATFVDKNGKAAGDQKELSLTSPSTEFIAGSFREDGSDVDGYSTTLSGNFSDRYIYAGYTTGTVKNSSVILRGGDFTNSSIYASSSGNAQNNLLVIENPINAFGVYGFSSLKFTLPETVTSGSSMLILKDGVDLTSSTINVDVTRADLKVGDSVNLIMAKEVSDFTRGEIISSGLVEVRHHIERSAAGDGVILTISSITENEKTKAPAESAASAMASMNAASDLAAGSITNLNPSGSTGSVTGSNFGSYNISSGSHCKVKGGGMVLGLTKRFNRMHAGFFTEFGKSSFDTYNGDYHGKGDSRYYGLGLLAKTDLTAKLSLDGSIKLGRVKTGWHNDQGAGYDDSALYLGGHLGVSREAQLKALKLKGYAQYLINRTGDTHGTISGLEYNFKATTSQRAKLGLYSEFGHARVKPYLDLAVEHEFDGRSKTTITNMNSSVTAPSIKGNTGVAEVGFSFGKEQGWYAKVGISGSVGVRRGVSGMVAVGYRF